MWAMRTQTSKGITTTIYLDTRKPLKDGLFPVKLRITYRRKSRFYSIGLSLTEEDFSKVVGEKPRGDYKEIQRLFHKIEIKAEAIYKDLNPFTFESFKQSFLRKSVVADDALGLIESKSNDLESQGRVNTAISYRCALNSMRKFWGRSLLPFEDVTPKFLENYESWMISNGNSLTTVGIYLRCIRSVYNQAIAKGLVNKDLYPFGIQSNRYTIPAPRNIKKALTIREIEKLFKYKALPGSGEELYLDVWKFSYLCNGINIKDICLLKYSDLSKDTVRFHRSKTSRTNRSPRPIIAVRVPTVDEIIEKWGVRPTLEEKYIFPFLDEESSPQRIKERVAVIVKQVNYHMAKIGKSLGINPKITTYTARHSFATILKRSGVNVSYISEALGHTDIKTTENYLDSFEIDQKRVIAEKLTLWSSQ